MTKHLDDRELHPACGFHYAYCAQYDGLAISLSS
jgi:hypothetical protein